MKGRLNVKPAVDLRLTREECAVDQRDRKHFAFLAADMCRHLFALVNAFHARFVQETGKQHSNLLSKA